MSKASSKTDIIPTPESEDEDVFEGGEFISLSESIEEVDVKRDARRKIEIYWEKKRLKEQFDDFDESEFGF
ncbi:MAG: hypothetical protein NT008_05745 [Methylococcales bacterium]|nr:hypothetical protein [Methylococcales bacterium]